MLTFKIMEWWLRALFVQEKKKKKKKGEGDQDGEEEGDKIDDKAEES